MEDSREQGFLTKDQILGQNTLPVEIVDVPEWGGKVRVKTLNARERDAFESSLVVGKGKGQRTSTEMVRAKLVSVAVVDAEGKPIFTAEDIERLGELSAAAMDRVYSVAAKLSGISEADVEDLAKNSGSGA